MNIMFEIRGTAIAKGAEHKPTEAEVEEAIERILADQLGVYAKISVEFIGE